MSETRSCDPSRLMKCHGLGGSQQWTFGRNNQLYQVSVGQCLKVVDLLSHKGYVAMAICDGSSSQQWHLEGAANVSSSACGRVSSEMATCVSADTRVIGSPSLFYTVYIRAPSDHLEVKKYVTLTRSKKPFQFVLGVLCLGQGHGGLLSRGRPQTPALSAHLRLGLEVHQEVLHAGLLSLVAGNQRQLLDANGLILTQERRQDFAPAGRALVEGAPEQRHGHPGEGRDGGRPGQLRAHLGPAQPRVAAAGAAGAGALLAAAGEQAPGAGPQHVAQEEEHQRGHQQEHQPVGLVPGGAAGALEHGGGEDALPARGQQGHQAVAQRVAVLEVQVQDRLKLLHRLHAPGAAGRQHGSDTDSNHFCETDPDSVWLQSE
ncbi:hypothetical protein QTO34_001066, partial [Cnephaeus nilssonii]